MKRLAWFVVAMLWVPAVAPAQSGIGPYIGPLGPDCCPGNPVVGVADDGSFTVVWETYESFLPLDLDLIQGRRFDAQGRALGPYFMVDPFPAGYQSSPRLAVAGDGSFYVSWLEQEQGGAAPRFVLKARHFGAIGRRPDGPVFRVGTGDGGEGFFEDPPDVVVTPGGGFAAIWQRGQDGLDGDRELIVRTFSPAGRPLGPEVVIATAPRGPLAPALAAGARDRLVAVWLGHDGDDVPTLLYRQLTANGEPLGPVRAVRSEIGDTPLDPAVAMSTKGDFLVAWTEDPTPDDELSPGGTRILARAFDRDGNATTSSEVVNGPLDPANGKAAVVADPEGGYLVAWTVGKNPPPSFLFCGLAARRFRPDAGAFTPRYELTESCSSFYESAVSFGLGDGHHGAAAWDAFQGLTVRRLGPRPPR